MKKYQLALKSALWNCRFYTNEGSYKTIKDLTKIVEIYKNDTHMNYKFRIYVPVQEVDDFKQLFPFAQILIRR